MSEGTKWCTFPWGEYRILSIWVDVIWLGEVSGKHFIVMN